MQLKDEQGVWHTWNNGLQQLIFNYFGDLFKLGGSDVEPILCNVPRRVTEEQNRYLLNPFEAEEVKTAPFSMHPDKAPGPDGMNLGFFQTYWDIVGEQVTSACLDCLQNCRLPLGINDTTLVLIPKKEKSTKLPDLRPISLSNIIYKIIAKVLANRLKHVLPSIISVTQSAFILGRMITNNIMIAHEVNHYLKRKRQGKHGFLALKMDKSKAYDRIEWQFLKGMLLKLGFHKSWVHKLIICVSIVRYHVL